MEITIPEPSPKIESHSWGTIKIAGNNNTFKDVKLYPGGYREWDWNETGTRHEPGIQLGDLQELLEHGAETVVLTKGVHERLKVCPETLQVLKEKGIEVYVEQTEKALKTYNNLVEQGVAVGGLFHSTC